MKKIIGKEKIFNFLINSFRESRVSHAYLFLGPEGVGKAFTAKLFAQFINCENRKENPCFECISCVKIEHNNHPDVYWIKPEEGSQGIKMEAMRTLQERIFLKPYEAKFKIFVLENVDYISEEAANCLLKTLEEPPGDALLILIAEEKERIIPTIISRCQIIKFNPISRDLLERFLVENYGEDKRKISFYSRLAEGSIGKALALLESDYLQRRISVLERLLEKREFNYDLWGKERDTFSEVLTFLNGIFRDAFLKTLGLDELIVNSDCRELIFRIASSYTQKEICNLIEKFDFYHRLIQNNVNLRLIFTSLEMDLERELTKE
ncbi:MAG: DNA polymerase III subunit delta' [Candidatus Omnitrophica bacterium]|nr:DNA polymerase III subunit delta' [Candidatus Omnitrophota bacterium]MCM8794121.1 DNA polymerase III subunit delta' [Candidatus Omnitrophota bacterium]